MTRINCVPPSELCRQHLVAEYRELPRIFNLVRAVEAKGLKLKDLKIPHRYVLGTGHCLFFYDKLLYLQNRQNSIIMEMKNRGYNVNFDSVDELVDGISSWFINDWVPDVEALKINRARISERMPKSA